jgi:hypothetical protein
MRRKVSLLSALVLMLSAIGLSAPSLVFATNPADPDGNVYGGDLAGRPLNGYSANTAGAPLQWQPLVNGGCGCYIGGIGSGHVISYAKYNGNIVALYPWHGRDDPTFDGKEVYGPNGSKIGYWYTDVCNGADCASNRDLAIIILYQGNWPPTKNKIVAGDPALNQYWTVTADPTSTYACGNLNSNNQWGGAVFQAFQRTISTTLTPRQGALARMYEYDGGTPPNHCLVETNLFWQAPYRDSGTPWRMTAISNTVHFFATFATPGTGLLDLTPLYDGLHILSVIGSGHLCHDASCT